MSEIKDMIGPVPQLPCVSVELEPELAKKVKAMKPGQVVQLTVVGKIERISFEAPYDPKEKGFEGRMSVEMQSADIKPYVKNASTELLDEED